MQPKVFVSHASEDKDEIARPLADALMRDGFQVWFDDYALMIGDSLKETIEEGIRTCDFGIVVLSRHFFSKSWPRTELNALFGREMEQRRLILPIWHNIDRKDIDRHSPFLLDKLALKSEEGVEELVRKIRLSTSRRFRHREALSTRKDRSITVLCRADGENLKEALIEQVAQQYGINRAEVQDARIKISNDLSCPLLDECFYSLTDGSRIQFLDEHVLSAGENLHALLAKRYTAVEWDVGFSANLETREGERYFDIAELEIFFLFVLRELLSDAASADAKMSALQALVQADTQPVNFGGETWRFSDGLFNGKTLCKDLLIEQLSGNRFDQVLSLITSPNTPQRQAFLLMSAALEHFEKPAKVLADTSLILAFLEKLRTAYTPQNNEYWYGKFEAAINLHLRTIHRDLPQEEA